MLLIEVLSWLFLAAGALMSIAGGIGIHRFPDFYSRLHAASTTDTMCAALFLIGLILQSGLSIASLKLLLIFAFLFFSSPTASHALANAAMLGNLKPYLDDDNPDTQP